MGPLWTNKFWGTGNRESPFFNGQEDSTGQAAFKSWPSGVTHSHCPIPLSNLSSPISTPHIQESQVTNGSLAESQQHADRWVNSSSLMGFLLLPDAIHVPRGQPTESAFKVKCATRPGRGQAGSGPGRCPRTPPPSGVPWPHPCAELLTAARPSRFPGLLLPASPHGGPESPRHPRTMPIKPGRSPPARLKLPYLSAAFSGHVPQPFPAGEPSKRFCWAKPHPSSTSESRFSPRFLFQSSQERKCHCIWGRCKSQA